MKDKSSKVEIPVEGSLGLLAYGFEGLVAWRQKRRSVRKASKENNKNTD